MSDTWVTIRAGDVEPGDRVRLPTGDEVTASRIDRGFMGMDALVALVEDTPERWIKRPLPADTEVEVRRAGDGDLAAVPVKTLTGQATTLAEHSGKALLIVNVASKCGLTPQYEGLERLHERYADRGFTV